MEPNFPANQQQPPPTRPDPEGTLEVSDAPMNYSYCFVCKEGGENLYGCDNCHRSYHFKNSCLPDKYLSSVTEEGEWTCPCCDLHRICSICQQQVRTPANQSVNCALCYRCVHVGCITLPQSLWKANRLVASQQLVNCPKCINSSAIKDWFGTSQIGGVEYCLVVPYNTATGHQGWLEKTHAQTILKSQKFKKRSIEQTKMQLECRIAKIIDVKPSKKYAKFDKEFMVETLGNSSLPRTYGAPENYRFLVKWVTVPSRDATWEDELVVIEEKQALNRYLTLLRAELAMQQRAARKEPLVNPLPRGSVASEDDLSYIASDGQRNSKLNIERRRQVVQVIDSKFRDSPNPQFPLNHREVVVLTDATNTMQWQADLKSVSKSLLVTLLQGTAQECSDIMSRELTLKGTRVPCFNLLLTSPRLLLSSLKLIEATVEINCKLLIVDTQDIDRDLCLDKIKLFTGALVFHFQYDGHKEADIKSVMGSKYRPYHQQPTQRTDMKSEHHQQEQRDPQQQPQPAHIFKAVTNGGEYKPLFHNQSIFAHTSNPTALPRTLSTASKSGNGPFNGVSSSPNSGVGQGVRPIRIKGTTPIIISKEPTTNRLSKNLSKTYERFLKSPTEFLERCGVTQLQRICILQYLVRFGLNRGSQQQFYKHLLQQNRDALGSEQNNTAEVYARQKQAILRYLQVLLSIIHEGKDLPCTSPILTPLFFEFNHTSLCKHFIELSNLKTLYEEYKDKPKQWHEGRPFHLYKNKKGELVVADTWSSEDDLELIRLTLEHGFGNWTKIVQSFMPARMDFRGTEYLIKRMRPAFKPLPNMSELSFCARMINNRMSAMLCDLWVKANKTRNIAS